MDAAKYNSREKLFHMPITTVIHFPSIFLSIPLSNYASIFLVLQSSIHFLRIQPSNNQFVHPMFHPILHLPSINFYPSIFHLTSNNSFVSYQTIYPSIFLSTHLTTYHSLNSSTHSAIHSSTHSSIYPSIHQYLYQPINPSIHPSSNSFIHSFSTRKFLC